MIKKITSMRTTSFISIVFFVLFFFVPMEYVSAIVSYDNMPESACTSKGGTCEPLSSGNPCSYPTVQIGICHYPLVSDMACCGPASLAITTFEKPCTSSTGNTGTCQLRSSASAPKEISPDCAYGLSCLSPTAPSPPPPGSCSTPNVCDASCPTDRVIGTCSSGLKCCKPVAAASTPINFTNPLKFDTVEDVLGSILSTLRGIIVVLSLVFIVIGAVLYILSAGDDGRMKTAKGAITASMIGLAIGIAAPSFLRQIGDILHWNDIPNPISDVPTLTEIALSTLQFLLSIVGILALVMLVIGGIAYITAGGDEKRSETGKKIVTYAIIGISIALASLIIVTQITKLLV